MNLVSILKALSDENRLRIIYLLMEDPLCVCEIEALLNITQSNASRHLNKLKHAGIIDSFKKAQWVYYVVSDHFKENNQELMTYLLKNTNYEEDKSLLIKYKNSVYDCTCLKEDKEKVLMALKK
ncbi:ArsR family transcriptional regulator [Natranaerovirga hydrolytica]|uniref:ArsR family transcriptional regulator n=1 Tax=Natranaerovirga hydrolytica TaxID=680378 RepID=A0A4R1MDC7_9FIRM|nr:metalloregulator ArsR/SmtB family transcription factor [Natranaerovirga hydrolytica]TCK90518.1 ArsR family transcriptional regulator [Natranaerovirga hydrolytica]